MLENRYIYIYRYDSHPKLFVFSPRQLSSYLITLYNRSIPPNLNFEDKKMATNPAPLIFKKFHSKNSIPKNITTTRIKNSHFFMVRKNKTKTMKT